MYKLRVVRILLNGMDITSNKVGDMPPIILKDKEDVDRVVKYFTDNLPKEVVYKFKASIFNGVDVDKFLEGARVYMKVFKSIVEAMNELDDLDDINKSDFFNPFDINPKDN